MRIAIPLLIVVSLLVSSGARAADRVVATTLDNGLRVLLLEDQRSPIVSFQMWYRVGSRNEHRGMTGIAHFLEHLMFKGTPTHGPKQFARLVEENGGQDNAFTSQDVTSYYVDIAADKLDWARWGAAHQYFELEDLGYAFVARGRRGPPARRHRDVDG